MKPDEITLTVLDSLTPSGLVTHKLIEIYSDSQTNRDLSVVKRIQDCRIFIVQREAL